MPLLNYTLAAIPHTHSPDDGAVVECPDWIILQLHEHTRPSNTMFTCFRYSNGIVFFSFSGRKNGNHVPSTGRVNATRLSVLGGAVSSFGQTKIISGSGYSGNPQWTTHHLRIGSLCFVAIKCFRLFKKQQSYKHTTVHKTEREWKTCSTDHQMKNSLVCCCFFFFLFLFIVFMPVWNLCPMPVHWLTDWPTRFNVYRSHTQYHAQ